MNVIFHTTTAIGLTVLLTDTEKLDQTKSRKNVIVTAVFAFISGVISHGVLDYIPHCYPINSKLDTISGVLMIIIGTWITKKRYRIISFLSFLGSIFPDLIDLSPSIINKLMGINLPIQEKIFPWHWHKYSGSIYNSNCNVSNLNYSLLILTIIIVCWFRRKDFKKIFNNA